MLIAGTPDLGFNGPSCVARVKRLSRYLLAPAPHSCSSELHKRDSWRWLRAVAQSNPKVKWLDLSQTICPNNLCSAVVGDIPVYRDSGHLTMEYVLSLKDMIAKTLSGL